MRIINGTDIVERKRIRKILHRFGKRFMEKILSEKELKILIKFSKNNELLSEKLSNRFAAKEAAAKALGTGFTNGVRFSDLEIINDKLGKPSLYFLGRSKTLLKEVKSDYRNHGVTLSISSEKEYSVAFVSIYFFNA
ncbi:MAG: holo-[acyl-carrier-protein] synthase [Rickettsiales bacterium]|nr:holo-[acyl-carrier-protein] synthase [Rickettsiales bacterium]